MPNKFAYRSPEKEFLDSSNINRDLLYKNLRELGILNRNTGGHTASLKGIKQLITNHNKTYNVVDLGCGGGDALKAIADWARKNKFRLKLTGIDVNADAIEFLESFCVNYPEIKGVTADYDDYLRRNDNIDVVHCSLFCHHLTNNELLNLFTYFRQHIKQGFVLNDLHRHWLPYYGAWFFTRLLNGSTLSKNDGPVSVLRGFTSSELIRLLNEAAINKFSIQNEWMFRFLIVGKTENYESMAG